MDELNEKLGIARGALLLAFFAGRSRGQVDLEEHYDAEQYGQAFVEAYYSQNQCKPFFPASTGRTVTVNLRSDKWREGIEKSTQETFERAFEILKTIIDVPEQKHLKFEEEYGNVPPEMKVRPFG